MSSSCEDELWCGDGASGVSAEAEVEVLGGVQVLSSQMISMELPHCRYFPRPDNTTLRTSDVATD